MDSHSKSAVNIFNAVGAQDIAGPARKALVESFVTEVTKQTPSSMSLSSSMKRKSNDEDGGPMALPCWRLDDDDRPAEGTQIVSLKTHSANPSPSKDDGIALRYPITNEFPHADINVGKNAEATVEAMMNAGGSCAMGECDYWCLVSLKLSYLFARFEELATYQERPIPIGGVGDGRILITHICELWMPWTIDGEATKLVIGLGKNMPMTLLVGLPFFIATQTVIDIGSLSMHSKTLDQTWKLTLKRPQRKDARTLDAILSSGKRFALSTSRADDSSASAKKIKWDVTEIEEDEE